jgi:hypothetical protein
MSNSKTAIAEIKRLMKQFGFLADDATLKSFKLEDNTILQTADLKVGEKISKINDAFEQVALEDGKFRLVENFEIEVENGEIKSVNEIFVDAKLADGTVVKVEGDGLVEGAKVVVITEDAEIPAPDGIHELESGDKIETKDGVIVRYEQMVDEEPVGVPEVEEPETPAMDAPHLMSGEIMDMLKEFISKMGEKVSKMEQNYNSLQNEFNSFKKQPAAKKIADGKVESFKLNNNDDVLEARLASLKSLQNK